MTTRQNRPILFRTHSSGISDLVDLMEAQTGAERGSLKIGKFNDGEIYVQIEPFTSVRRRSAIVVGSTNSRADILQFYFSAHLMAEEGARNVTIAVPASTLHSDPLTASYLQRLFSTVPNLVSGTSGANAGSVMAGATEGRGQEHLILGVLEAAKPVSNKPVIFSIPSYASLTMKINDSAGYEQGRVDWRTPGQAPIVDSMVLGRHVVVVGGTVSPEDTLDLFYLCNQVVDRGARSLTILVPYFGYARSERKTKAGEAVTAKYMAIMFGRGIKQAAEGNTVVLFDPHTDALPEYFDNVQVIALSGRPLVIKATRMMMGRRKFKFATTDFGRANWLKKLADTLNVDVALAWKRREDGSHVESLGIVGDVEGWWLVVYDDMIGSGESMDKAVAAYLANGAIGVCVVATHGVLQGDALTMLRSKGRIKHMIVMDSHPQASRLAVGDDQFFQVLSTAPLFLSWLQSQPHLKRRR